MQNPTYPLDRRILEIIMELTGTTQEVNLDADVKASGDVFKRISQQVADGAWESIQHEYGDAARPKKYKPFHINTWKSVFGHNNHNAGMSPTEDTIKQLTLFLDYDNWDELMKDLEDRHQRHQARIRRNVTVQIPHQNFSEMKLGEELEVYWPKSSDRDEMERDAFMRITYVGNGRFSINTVRNCSLEAGETFEIVCLEEEQRFILNNRKRNGLPIAVKGYISGKPVTKIKKLPKRS